MISTQNDLVEAMALRGWVTARDETSMPFAELRSGNRVFHALLTKRGPEFPFDLGGWVTTGAFSVAYTLLDSKRRRKRIAKSCPLEQSPPIRIERSVANDADIDAAIAQWIDWGRNVDLEAGIAKLLDKEANQIGAMPARHLAALAATGDVRVLEHYQNAFAQGDRLGFVPYITADYIESALAFARQRSENPDWLPKSPKLRV